MSVENFRPALTQFSEDEIAFRDAIAQFAESEIKPHVTHMDEEAQMNDTDFVEIASFMEDNNSICQVLSATISERNTIRDDNDNVKK